MTNCYGNRSNVALSMLIGVMALQALLPALTVTATQRSNSLCPTVAAWLIAQEPRLTTDDVAVLSGCALASDGTWFWPESAVDPRLAVPIMSAEQFDLTLDIHRRLNAQIDAFALFLTTGPDWIFGEFPNLLTALNELSSGDTSLGRGAPVRHTSKAHLFATGAVGYAAIGAELAKEPGYELFAAYVDWWIQRRVDALTPELAATIVNHHAILGTVDFVLRRPPWLWEMRRLYTQAEFRKWLLENMNLEQVLDGQGAVSTTQ